MEYLLDLIASPKLWISVAIFIIAIIVTAVIRHYERRFSGSGASGLGAIFRVIGAVIRYLIIVLSVLAVLQLNGINVTSIITSLGVVGIIVGFALQDILKDVIMGINIVTENFMRVGDVIEYENDYWLVTELTVRMAKLRNIESNEILTVSNRNFSEMRVQSDYQDLIIPADYRVPNEKMRAICDEIRASSASIDDVTQVELLGADRFESSQISYRLRVYSNPVNRHKIRRSVNRVVLDVFDRNGVAVPFNQLDVHLDQ